MPYNIRIVSTYPPRKCGIGTFSRDLANALSHFTQEVGHIRIAAIDHGNGPYNIPVDLIIDQYNHESWLVNTREIIARAKASSSPTAVLLQHEYGLDPDEQGNPCRGMHYVELAKELQRNDIITFTYLHTVLEDPDEHQRKVLIELARYSDALIVITDVAADILESDAYGISKYKIRCIDHGIRMQSHSEFDRLAMKQECGFEGRLLVSTLGLRSPGKGIEYGIRGYARFVNESLTPQQRKKIVYLIAGPYHPDFVKAEGGKYYRDYTAVIQKALDESGLKWCDMKQCNPDGLHCCDIAFMDDFMTDQKMLKLYGASNIMLLPYLNMQQISSGILADTIGSGRVAIATKFRYACELLFPDRAVPEGVIIDRHARGVLIDPGEESVEQIAQALDFLVFHREERLKMEKRAHQRGYQMRWANSAWSLLQHIDFVKDQKEIVTGRGVVFEREKDSVFAKRNDRILPHK